MTTVTYTASEGYKFPEASDYYKTTNGITVTRTSDTVVTVSGTPTDNANITVPDAIPEQKCGENVTWTLEGGTLTISGTGAMYDYNSRQNVPWYNSRTNITTVVIEEGVTTIGDLAFYHCNNLSI